MMTKGCRPFLIAGSGKPRRGHKKRCGSPKQRRGHEKHALAEGNKPGATRGRATARPQKLRRGHKGLTQKARNLPELGLQQQNRFRNSRETQRTEKKAFRARANSAQSARQGGTEPGTTRFKDGRATTGPPAPRRGPGAPAVQPRPRGLALESAQVLRGAKFAILAPNLDLNNETDLEA